MSNNDVKAALDQMNSIMSEVRSAVVISSGSRSARLPQTPKPIRGVDYKRTINPVTWLRAKIQAFNETSTDAKYIQFSENSDHLIAVHAKAVIGRLLRDHLGEQYGKVSWTRACTMRSCRDSCEKVVEEASKMKEFVSFTYSYDGWAIRMLCDAKMKSAMRAEKVSTKSSTTQSDTPNAGINVSRDDQEKIQDEKGQESKGAQKSTEGREITEDSSKNITVQAAEVTAKNTNVETKRGSIENNKSNGSSNACLLDKGSGIDPSLQIIPEK